MTAAPTILAIDHGTSGIKAAVVSVDGEVRDFAFRPTPIHYLPGGGAEQDPDDWWSALVAACRELMARGDPGAVEAICVSSTFSTTVMVDRDGQPLMRAITWLDSRGAPHVRKVMGGFPTVLGYNVAKVARWVARTGGGPTLSGKDDAAHALLVKHEFPDVYQRTHKFLPSKDYLNLRLTGRMAATFDSIMLFWVTDTRDPSAIHYDDELIRGLGLDRDKLPDLVAATDVLGTLTPAAAEELGLPASTRVVAGSPDHQAACIGSGAVRDLEGHLYIGTSSWVQCVVPFKKTDVLHSIASLPSAIPGRYQSVNEQDIAGGALPFLLRNVLFHDNALRSGPPPDDVYRVMDEIAAEVPPGAGGLLFTPWLNGERTPVDDENLRGALIGLSTTTNQDHVIRAVLEGVALNTRWSLGHVDKFAGRRLDPLRIVGGGGRSGLWCQIFADVLGREIHQVADPMQANARGAALIASVGLGHISFDDIPDRVGITATYRPDPIHRALYDGLFDEFTGFHRRNHKMFGRLRKLTGGGRRTR